MDWCNATIILGGWPPMRMTFFSMELEPARRFILKEDEVFMISFDQPPLVEFGPLQSA
jgi:hypothetical protein